MRRNPLRRAIKLGACRGLAGSFGRWLGHNYGWRLKYGPKIIIDQPQEYMQAEMLRRGVYEEHVIVALLAVLKPGDVFYDVGANIGHHSLIAAYHGAIVNAFEPVPRLANRLVQNIAFNALQKSIAVFEVALSDEAGDAVIYVASRADDGSHSLFQGVVTDDVAPCPVRMITLDEHANRHVPPDIVKIDVEGAEEKVIDGAQRTFAESRPLIIFEAGDRNSASTGTGAAVCEKLQALGYRIFCMPAVHPVTEEIPRTPAPACLSDYVAVHRSSDRLPALLGALRIPG